MSDIPKTMRAAVYRGVNDIRIETVPVPRIGANELLVKVAACGVCPTDIKKIQHGTVPPPRIFGHETAGTIVQIGSQKSEVRSQKLSSALRTPHSEFKVGDRVALHHHVPCLDCHFCRHRAFAQCETYKRTGITAGFEPAGGGFAEYVRVMDFVLPGVVKIPAKNSFAEGAMLEPVNTVLKAVRKLSLLPGDTVLVAGQGPVGLMFTRLLQLAGMNVLATDLLASRLRLARKFGAKWTKVVAGSKLQVAGSTPAANLQPSTFNLQRPIDAAVIAVPSDDAVHQALQLLRGGGQILLFAHTKRIAKAESGKQKAEKPGAATELSTFNFQLSAFPLDLSAVCVDEKDLLGSYSADFTIQAEVARLVFSRRLDVRPLITHTYPLAQTAAAIAQAARPTPDSLKILVSG